jgi:hypothetical protein
LAATLSTSVSSQLTLAQTLFSDIPFSVGGSENAFQHLRLTCSAAELASDAAAALYIQHQPERGESIRLQQLSVLSDSDCAADVAAAVVLDLSDQQAHSALSILQPATARIQYQQLRCMEWTSAADCQDVFPNSTDCLTSTSAAAALNDFDSTNVNAACIFNSFSFR